MTIKIYFAEAARDLLCVSRTKPLTPDMLFEAFAIMYEGVEGSRLRTEEDDAAFEFSLFLHDCAKPG